MPRGRPSKWSQAVADKICAKLADGQSMRTVCRGDDMPSTVTVFSWLRTKPDFLKQYVRAKQEAADALVEEMLDIADDGTNDWMERNTEEGEATGWRVNGEHIQRSRVRIDTRKWLASKLKPKIYGESQHHSHSGTIKHEDVSYTDTEFANRLAFLYERGGADAIKQALTGSDTSVGASAGTAKSGTKH